MKARFTAVFDFDTDELYDRGIFYGAEGVTEETVLNELDRVARQTGSISDWAEILAADLDEFGFDKGLTVVRVEGEEK